MTDRSIYQKKDVAEHALLDGYTDPRALAGLPRDATLVVALSGGADSVALLLLTPPPVVAAHVHHGIRGAEADRDAAFCRALCERLGVPFTCLYTDVPTRARERGESLETAARSARYELLEAYAKEQEAGAVLTAHHADDQLETILQHLFRGSGLRGLCGIRPVRALGDTLLVRPMLGANKEEILSFLAARGETFVTDSTNEKADCQRNLLRLKVLPELYAIMPNAAKKAADAAKLLFEDEAYLEATAKEAVGDEPDRVPVEVLASLPYPIFVRAIQGMFPADLSKDHFDAIFLLVQKAVPHSALSLPRAVARIENGFLFFEHGTSHSTRVPTYRLPILPGENRIPEIGATVLLTNVGAPLPSHLQKYRYTVSADFCADRVVGDLFVRNRCAGDRILVGGMHKAVRRLSALSVLPLDARARMPLLLDGEGLLAVPFYRVRDGVADQKENNKTVWFCFD